MVTEYFQNNANNQSKQKISKETQNKYSNFLVSYTEFCKNWQKAIESSVALNTPQEPLTSPSQINTSNVQPQISVADMNNFIAELSQKSSKSYPNICTQLPTEITIENIEEVIKELPQSSEQYINALNWMNEQMSKSHSNLDVALKGGKRVEGFNVKQNGTESCENVMSCVENNPEIADEISKKIDEKNKESILNQENKLNRLLNLFLENNDFVKGLDENKSLVKKSEDIQKQAQSGELINRINIPDTKQRQPYVIPEGGNKLTEMKENNPDQYNNLKQNYSNWFSLKQLIEQINSNLK
jgi:hypothetical protein